MIGDEIGKVCYFCNRNNLGLFKKELPTTKLIICQGCCKGITIAQFNKYFKFYPQSVQKQTLIEITDDNSFRKSNKMVHGQGK